MPQEPLQPEDCELLRSCRTQLLDLQQGYPESELHEDLDATIDRITARLGDRRMECRNCGLVDDEIEFVPSNGDPAEFVCPDCLSRKVSPRPLFAKADP